MSLHVLSLTCLSVPLCGRTERTVIQQLVWPAGTAGRLWNLGVLSSNLNIVYVILCFVEKNKVFSFFRTLLLSPSAPSPDRIYSPNYGCSRGDGVAPSPLAARRSTGSAAGRTSGFSSRLCGGFSPTQPAGGTAGPAAGQPVRRSGFHISPGSRKRSSSPRGTAA